MKTKYISPELSESTLEEAVATDSLSMFIEIDDTEWEYIPDDQ